MKCSKIISAGFLVFLFSTFLFTQTVSRETVLGEIEDLNQKIKQQEKFLLAVANEDVEKYKNFLLQENTGIVRLMPREKYDRKLTINGGGAYYSFVRKTHEYGFGSDISLERNAFSVGFAGRDFGVFKDLGKVPIESLTLESEGVKELAQFDSPLNANVNSKQVLTSTPYNSRIAAEMGKTYVLRSVNLERSDIIVVFHALREDFDGSFVLVWKILKSSDFEDETKDKILTALRAKGFYDVTVVWTKPITLRGTVPKGKTAEVIRIVMEAVKGTAVRNEMIEK